MRWRLRLSTGGEFGDEVSVFASTFEGATRRAALVQGVKETELVEVLVVSGPSTQVSDSEPKVWERNPRVRWGER